MIGQISFMALYGICCRYRGFAGHPPELKWLLKSPIFSQFSLPFLGSTVSDVLWQKPSSLLRFKCQPRCYAFRYVLSYFHNEENELTELKQLIRKWA